MHRSHAGIDGLSGGWARTLVHVIRGHHRPEARDRREVAVRLLVAREAAEQCVPHMPVGLDESRQHDHVGGVDDLRIGSIHIGADRDDRAITYMD